eukprot:1009257-Ditylum_brightwellii.AAC.1
MARDANEMVVIDKNKVGKYGAKIKLKLGGCIKVMLTYLCKERVITCCLIATIMTLEVLDGFIKKIPAGNSVVNGNDRCPKACAAKAFCSKVHQPYITIIALLALLFPAGFK